MPVGESRSKNVLREWAPNWNKHLINELACIHVNQVFYLLLKYKSLSIAQIIEEQKNYRSRP